MFAEIRRPARLASATWSASIASRARRSTTQNRIACAPTWRERRAEVEIPGGSKPGELITHRFRSSNPAPGRQLIASPRVQDPSNGPSRSQRAVITGCPRGESAWSTRDDDLSCLQGGSVYRRHRVGILRASRGPAVAMHLTRCQISPALSGLAPPSARRPESHRVGLDRRHGDVTRL